MYRELIHMQAPIVASSELCGAELTSSSHPQESVCLLGEGF